MSTRPAKHSCKAIARFLQGAYVMVTGRMRRLLATSLVAIATLGTSAAHADARRLCVGSGAHCFASIQAAIDAANGGDVVHIGPGTFEGGITIDESLQLIGAGAGVTVIRGGGPVLTIGVPGASSEPTVSIRGVTITGGVNSSSPAPFSARGGGIDVPAGANGAPGATVVIADSVVAGNRAAPEATIPSPSGVICAGGTFCPFAGAEGGGIAHAGAMTLVNVVVSDNEAGSGLASDSNGGGIATQRGATLTLRNTVVTRNRAWGSAPNGRFADGGGVRVRFGGALTMYDSVVSDNHVELPTAMPTFVEVNTVAGGIHLGDAATGTIRGSTIGGNTVTGANTLGNGIACAGALMLNEGGTLVLRDSTLSDNHVSATAVTASSTTGDSLGCSGGIDLSGAATITGTRFVRNSVSATTSSGAMSADSGALANISGDGVTIRDSLFSGNTVTAVSTTGAAVAHGGAILNAGLLTIRGTVIADNVVAVRSPDAVGQGGGIYNGPVPGVDLPVQLTLDDSVVVRNRIVGTQGSVLEGGGLFTAFPAVLTGTVLAQNSPDQCHGC